MLGVTLDTNEYVSALEFGGAAARLLGMARAGIIRIDASNAILDELITVLRDDFHWNAYRLHAARDQVARLTNVVTPARTVQVIADEPDNRILECAETAESDYIISEDKDLLRLSEHAGIKIVRIGDFLREIQPGRQR